MDLADRWTQETVEAMFVQGDGYVAVGTARNTTVPVTISVEDSKPATPPDGADRTAAGRLSVPAGELVVTGVTDNGASGGRIAIPPGDYEVTVFFRGLDSVSEDGLSGDDRYEVVLWPARQYERRPS